MLDCPFCQGKNLKTISQPDRRTIYHCLDCGLVSAARLEKKEYQKKKKDWYKTYLGEKPYSLPRFAKRLAEIEKRKKPGKILDIGCATGFFLELAQKHGWKTFGVDILKENADYCQKTLVSEPIFCGSLKQAGFKDNFFDTIVVFDTLEHITDPSSFLTEARRVLKPDGLLAITVPNQAGLVSQLLGKDWFDYQKPQHLYFFTPQTLKMVLEKANLKIIFEKKEIFWPCPVKRMLVKLRKYYPHPLIKQGSLLAEKLAQSLKIKSLIFPLEHLYVIAKKN